ncbi:YqaA family protein [Methylocystis echinoides]|jgi:membrane protein YqaA with SNARE-associated domain|uniref:Cytochrome b561 n=1 Tax=Methylocystis echinoides TaxID=29468 RepID=A0A9W6GUY4_9HYPH|nr:YqaA family protein [Methylocystis echinoides]GLI93408.1 cytochrome b561 [Methylocystis echinoides]
MKKLYDWTMSLAASRHAPFALGAIAFAESSFFPVPPDVILVPMTLAEPRKAWLFAAICTVASVAGGALGYAFGALFYDSIGHWLIDLYGYGPKMEALRAFYAQWGAIFILVKGFTPIPYKLVTIVSGLLAYNFPLFLLLSLITRGARFFVLAAAINHFGDPIRDKLESHFGLFVGSLAVIVVAGFALAAKMF